MEQRKLGLQVFDETGTILLEVGPQVVSEFPEFAKRIGAIAASWSQAEVNLNCLFASLLGKSPEEVAKELDRYRNAASVTRRAREIAAKHLKGPELDSLNEILGRLDKARLARNRVQHDVWARKASDSRRLFAIHADDYFALATKLMAMNSSKDADQPHLTIDASTAFAGSVSNGYTIEELEDICMAIESASRSLLEAMFQQIRLRLSRK